MKITWLGHSCMKISDNGYSVVCDPFAPGFPEGYDEIHTTADVVLCSHDHGDHNYTDAVTLVPSGAKPFEITMIDSFHDDRGGILRGKNKIHVLKTAGGASAVHLGDLGHMLNKSQFDAIGHPDVLMIPVGGFYTIDAETAKEICERISPRVIIPMHYRGDGFGFDVLATVEDFAKLFPKVHYSPSREIEITPELTGVIVMNH